MKTKETWPSFLSKIWTKGKILIPATLIALSSLLSSCSSSIEETKSFAKIESAREKIKLEEAKDIDFSDHFTDLGEGVYLYKSSKGPISLESGDMIRPQEEFSLAIKQFLEKHKDLKIGEIISYSHCHEYTIITEKK